MPTLDEEMPDHVHSEDKALASADLGLRVQLVQAAVDQMEVRMVVARQQPAGGAAAAGVGVRQQGLIIAQQARRQRPTGQLLAHTFRPFEQVGVVRPSARQRAAEDG